MQLIKNIKSRLSMEYLGYGFIDMVTGETVNYYIDKYGDCYMATNKSLFGMRMKTKPPTDFVKQ